MALLLIVKIQIGMHLELNGIQLLIVKIQIELLQLNGMQLLIVKIQIELLLQLNGMQLLMVY